MRHQKGFTLLELVTVLGSFVFCIAGLTGWIWNIVKIIDTGFDVMNGMFIARCIGVFFAPLGAVLGFF